MKIIYGIKQIKKYRKPVVALGVFDGVHLGHQRILRAAVNQARRIKGKSIVVTFWPDPHKEENIYSLKHRLRLIGAIGIDVCVVIRFNRSFSHISAGDFVKNILVRKIGANYIYVGENYRFGQGGEGDFKSLKKLSLAYHFDAKAFDILKINGRPISSTYIRRLITYGELIAAAKFLSRPVSILGTVIRGSSLATRLGFPTANINPHHEVLPPCGVYAVSVILGNKKLKGACYIGTRPTFKKQKQIHVEVHIFNFKKIIYGKDLEILFLRKIRGDKKFSSVSALVQQIKKDLTASSKTLSLPFSSHNI